jgi:hypothetical protein
MSGYPPPESGKLPPHHSYPSTPQPDIYNNNYANSQHANIQQGTSNYFSPGSYQIQGFQPSQSGQYPTYNVPQTGQNAWPPQGDGAAPAPQNYTHSTPTSWGGAGQPSGYRQDIYSPPPSYHSETHSEPSIPQTKDSSGYPPAIGVEWIKKEVLLLRFIISGLSSSREKFGRPQH